jgi:CheY-like chemotaxis protein
MNSNPIIVIDDDDEDLELITQAFEELRVTNELILFRSGASFLEFMKTTEQKVFFILCDINMSPVSGLELKRMIFEDERLRLKCIPFIFLSTSGASSAIMSAYSFGVQGYFIKPNSFEGLKRRLQSIMSYWDDSQHPNR